MQAKPAAKLLKDYTPPSHQVAELALTFELAPHATLVSAKSTWLAVNNSRELTLQGVELELLEVKVNGVVHQDFTQTASELHLTSLPTQFTLDIQCRIDPAGNTSLEGLYQSGGAYCTQCEAEGFRKITYFLDRPDVLTQYTVTIIAPKEVPYLLSNGNKIDSGDLPDGRHFAKWHDPFNKPSYLFALVAGDFDVLEDTFVTQSGREVSLQLFVDKGNLGKAPHAMTSLKKAMAWDESRFKLEYDLDIYMIVAVDFFNMGAMENKGLNIFNSACVLANQETATDRDFHTIESIVGHEYFHNWTGNRITCRDWFQLSLKEGLTVFRDQEFSSDLGSRGLNRIDAVEAMRNHQFAEDAGPMAHPIRPEQVIEMNNFYTVTVYNKGAEVIRMLHTLLGEAGFQAGMQLYVSRHDGQAATCDDFVAAMADANDADLTQFKLWYSQFGTPRLVVDSVYDSTQQTLTLNIKQLPPKNNPEQAMLHIPVAIELLDDMGKSVPLSAQPNVSGKVLHVKAAEQSFTFTGVTSKPAVVMLEDFSAPVQVQFDSSLADKLHILRFARSDYARWEAMQQIYTVSVVQAINSGIKRLDAEIVAACGELLSKPVGDLALISELLTLPSFDTLIAQFETIPVEALCETLAAFEHQLACELKPLWLSCYAQLQEDGSLSAAAVGTRALKNTCLGYLAKVSDVQIDTWLKHALENPNMTLKLGALKAMVDATHSGLDDAMAAFDGAWRHDALVMDKWFALQAQRRDLAAITRVKGLYQHPRFDKGNPNRVRALVGSLARANPSVFHRADGSGYQLLGDLLVELNAINPQNASRMLTPFMSWRRFDSARGELIRAQLQRLAALSGLSDDLYEKVSKALEA
ncbi:aminopeptidase N [Pseudoalteromonas fenneropenaei]|uniref:Aminopeptidase N n=1 Tax=Pseudoalteromonas fenneropenaei TaxID=1737459 RepID=A0ABV7CHM2_9GAMM